MFDPTLFVSDTDYGFDQIEILCNHYKLDLMSCKQEWMGFKEVMSTSTQTCSNIVNELLFANYSLAYPLLSKLAGYALSLPVSNAECEERFQCNEAHKYYTRELLSN